MYRIFPANDRERVRAWLLPFQSFVVLSYLVFLFLAASFSPVHGYGSAKPQVAGWFQMGCFLSSLVLLIAAIIQLCKAIFGNSDKAFFRYYACLNFALAVCGAIIGFRFCEFIFVK